jgi:drug/metabolite transporter (DMT)-like permease
MSKALSPARWKLILAFAAIYLIWGSNYLAIRVAVESIPPFLLGSGRFFLAGVVLIFVAWRRGDPLPTRANWFAGTITGGLLFALSTGGLMWASQFVPSSITAVMNALIPMWMIVIAWLWTGTERPTPSMLTGVLLGFIGILLLVVPNGLDTNTGLHWPGMVTVMITPIIWAFGTVYAQRAALPASPLMSTGIQLFAGGALLFPFSLIAGELAQFQISEVAPIGAAMFFYLLIAGSLVSFTAYVWLTQVSTPARISTYAYVNPVVALVLGATLGEESLTLWSVVGVFIILASVVIITTAQAQGSKGLFGRLRRRTQ